MRLDDSTDFSDISVQCLGKNYRPTQDAWHCLDEVRELRKEKGLSQEELSFKADLHRTYIGMIERAEKNITLTNIEKIAKALDVKVKDLFDETR